MEYGRYWLKIPGPSSRCQEQLVLLGAGSFSYEVRVRLAKLKDPTPFPRAFPVLSMGFGSLKRSWTNRLSDSRGSCWFQTGRDLSCWSWFAAK